MRSVISLIKLIAFLILCFIAMPLLVLNSVFFSNSKKFYIIPKFYHSLVCFIYRIKVNIKGTPDNKNHVVFVGNHLSYIDIPVIGSTLTATFIAKADVRKWPIFGILSNLAQTIFIERTREAATQAISDIKQSLNKGRSLILFPEGTSTQGLEVLPFKSSIFDLFLRDELKEKLLIQPFTVSIQKVNNHTVKIASDHDSYAWYGDMTMLPHLWNIGKSKGAEILLTFHPARAAQDYDNRKMFATDCHKDVQKGLENSLSQTLDLKAKAS